MNHCTYCNIDYKDKRHKHTATHLTNEYRTFLSQRLDKNDSNYQERENAITEYREEKEHGHYACINCNFEVDKLTEMLKHEEKCLGLKVDKSIQIFNFLECAECGYKIQINGQKMKPKYMMNAHKKTCGDKVKKNRIKIIKQSLNNLDNSLINEIFKMINK